MPYLRLPVQSRQAVEAEPMPGVQGHQNFRSTGPRRVTVGRSELLEQMPDIRAYHTVQHLDECFARLDEASSLAACLPEIELALWFHDAVYDVRAHDNEERSARWAQSAAREAGLSGAVRDRLQLLILATKHMAAPPSRDAALLVECSWPDPTSTTRVNSGTVTKQPPGPTWLARSSNCNLLPSTSYLLPPALRLMTRFRFVNRVRGEQIGVFPCHLHQPAEVLVENLQLLLGKIFDIDQPVAGSFV